MRRIIRYRVLCYLAMFLVSSISAYTQSNSDLAARISHEFDVVKEFSMEAQTTLSLDYRENVTSESVSNGYKMIINVPQLQNIIEKTGSQNALSLIRLVIAHEFGHQIQYRYYSNIRGSKLFECQADIFAGFFLFQVTSKELAQWGIDHGVTAPNDTRYAKKLQEVLNQMYAALTAIFDQGNDYEVKDYHPGTESRRLALRDGLAYGNLWMLDQIVQHPELPGNNIQTISTSKTLEDNYKATLNWIENDNVITWSYRHAKKIIHQNIDNCKDVMVYIDYHWNTSSNHPFITYSQKFRNIGAKTLTLSYYNQLYTVLRNNPDNTLYWDLKSTKPYTITLGPGIEKTIRDSMQWVSSDKLMPSFTFAGGEGSLYLCSSLSDPEDSRDASGHTFWNGGPAPAAAMVLDNFINARRIYADYIAGIGLVYTKNSYEDIYYPCKIKAVGSTTTKVHLNTVDHGYSIEADYSNLKNISAANAVATNIITDLKSQAHDVTPDTGTPDHWWIKEGSENIGEMSLEHIDAGYSIYLVFYGKN